jgi:hypothetical protein
VNPEVSQQGETVSTQNERTVLGLISIKSTSRVKVMNEDMFSKTKNINKSVQLKLTDMGFKTSRKSP